MGIEFIGVIFLIGNRCSLSLKGFIPLKFIICILKNDFEFEHTFPLKHKFELYCNLRGKNVED